VRQVLSREKLLSKLLLSIQAFTYSCSCEAFEAKREYRKVMHANKDSAKSRQEYSTESINSKFGISGVVCDGKLVVMPKPSRTDDDGFQPFNGRLGKMRYLALAIMAAAGAVSADLIQLAMALPVKKEAAAWSGMDTPPERAPIVYPMLFGNVLTHVVVAICATCGRARAQSDALDVVWSVPFSSCGNFVLPEDFASRRPSVEEDCEAFLKLGFIARTLQALLGAMGVPSTGFKTPKATAKALQSFMMDVEAESASTDIDWIKSCVLLLCTAISSSQSGHENVNPGDQEMCREDALCLEVLKEACVHAAEAVASFLADAGVILQIVLPGVLSRYEHASQDSSSFSSDDVGGADNPADALREWFHMESLDDMLQSSLVQQVVSSWYDTACLHAMSEGRVAHASMMPQATLKNRLYRTQGFRLYDWPSAGSFDVKEIKEAISQIGDKDASKDGTTEQSRSVPSSPMQIESIAPSTALTPTSEVLRKQPPPTLVTFLSKKTVALLGGFTPDTLSPKPGSHPRVAVIPTSYTDLYAELGTLLPDCEQTAVCLICGEVLNAAGKGECTRHSYKCGAGAGMFFLLQECSGLIMHKSKAAYIHSPYVDSHGETPQYRGRPLNLDLDRYEHLREVWYGHAVRQQVVAERGSSRQVILPDFY
jgi:Proteolysis_6 C-terminal